MSEGYVKAREEGAAFLPGRGMLSGAFVRLLYSGLGGTLTHASGHIRTVG